MTSTTWILSAVAVVAPVLAAHTISAITGEGAHILLVVILECCGFALLVTALRPKLLLAIAAAALYFPLVFFLIFQLGVRAGYYDFP